MMRGMGEEQVFKITLLNEAVAADGEPEEEEEVAGDFDDFLAMMSGMGEERVYKVTLLNEA
eukprot:5785904-Lingulodinium_polyedra.AAC.1